MSKKNNLQNRQKAHKFALEREKAETARLKKKQERKQARDAEPAAAAPAIAAAAAAAAGPSGGSKLAPALKSTKMKRKAVRIKKNATVRGIRIRDAASKQKVRAILAEEEAQRTMDADPAPKKTARASKAIKTTKKTAAVAKAVMELMALD